MSQVQCPNCAGYYTHVKDTGRGCSIYVTYIALIFLGLIAAPIFLGSLIGLVIFFPGSEWVDGGPGMFFLSICGLFGAPLLVMLAFIPFVIQQRTVKRDILFCDSCGYSWDKQKPDSSKLSSSKSNVISHKAISAGKIISHDDRYD